MAGCKLGSSRVEIAAPRIFVESYCVSRDTSGNIRICLFQTAPNKEVCVSRIVISPDKAKGLAESIMRVLPKEMKRDESEEMRYIV